MHTINVVFLLVDTASNCLRFPYFRIAYVFLWTMIYVIFHWLVHVGVNVWWPYPFLDLSFSCAPLWYFSVALMHFPCYGAFALVIKLKHHVFSRWFLDSYQCVRTACQPGKGPQVRGEGYPTILLEDPYHWRCSKRRGCGEVDWDDEEREDNGEAAVSFVEGEVQMIWIWDWSSSLDFGLGWNTNL
ncbi:hypothetical protein CRYUN_Cryun23aG0002000 [Craigia yunnanensis]